MEEIITADTILEFLKTKIESKSQLNPDIWLDASAKLNLLLGDEIDKLVDMKQKVSEIKLEFLDKSDKHNVSEARLRTEATEHYRLMKKQESKCDRIEEFIRISKLIARKEGNF